ncbi:MAG: glycosyltransferase family 4 protein [Candidatus Omnitrophica bacterium]|nr:glycosyltransferase family 4 protein [Candidatus Omnitrophota bacterium]
MKLLEIFNCSIKKDCGFTDLFLELAAQCQADNIKLDFVVPAASQEVIVGKLRSNNAGVFVVPLPWDNNAAVKAMKKLVNDLRPDAVNFHFCDSLNFAGLFLWLKFKGIKVIFHYHGEIRPIKELGFVNRHFSKLRFINFFTDKIICVSNANRNFLKALHINKPIDMVYNGLALDKYNFKNVERDLRKELGFSGRELVITFIGSLIHRKGIDVLLPAARMVVDQISDARFVIVGGQDQSLYLKMAEDLGIKDKVFFLGFIEDYPFFVLKDTNIYVSASRAESFGLSIAEAQLLGIPVIATAVGGVPEVVDNGKTGLLVPTEDSRTLAEAILKVAKDHTLAETFAKNGPIWIRKKFDIRDRVKEILKVCFEKSKRS